MHYKFLADYEWHYYIGGNCSLRHRKSNQTAAMIHHVVQGSFEALISRKQGTYPKEEDFISVGVFNDSNEAQEVINKILEEKFNEVRV